MSSSTAEGKRLAASAAAALVETGMIVGLGSGTTSALVVEALGERLDREGLRISGVPTSRSTAELAQRLSIPLVDIDSVPSLDLAIDGADEVDPAFNMIKGGGGAHLREKIVATAAHRRVIVVTPEKLVTRLGTRFAVPVEVTLFGLKHTENALRNQGAVTTLRRTAEGTPFMTDEGNRIIDCRFLHIEDPEELERRLNGIVGVVETGLFVGLCDQLIVGHPEGPEIVDQPV